MVLGALRWGIARARCAEALRGRVALGHCAGALRYRKLHKKIVS